MDPYAVWGSEDVPAALPSPPLSFPPSPPTRHAPADDWGHDGGWGAATDDFSADFSTPGDSDPAGLEVTTEDIDVGGPATSPGSFGGGWGRSQSPGLAPIASLATPTPDLDPPAASDSPLPSRHADLEPEPEPRSPDLPDFTVPPSPPFVPSEPPPEDAEPTRADDDWGGYGEEQPLPPIAAPDVEAEASPATGGWGGDDEWHPAEIPLPLPSFGGSFSAGGKPEREEEKEEEGWGGANEDSWGPALEGVEVPSRPETNHREDGEWDAEPSQGVHRGKSIPASLVDGLKVGSRKLADVNWTVPSDAWGKGGFQEESPEVVSMLNSLLEPPTLPPVASTSTLPPITSQTPLSSLFRFTPTLYPAFRNGLDKTAVRATETLKGTTSAAYRNAKFGRGALRTTSVDTSTGGAKTWDLESPLGRPDLPSERGYAGDEFDVDGPGGVVTTAQVKSSWWGSGSQAPAPTTNMPKSLLKRKEDEAAAPVSPTRRTASPAPDNLPPSAIGRFFGRFRHASPSLSPPHSRSASSTQDESVDWSGDLSYLDGPGHPSQIAQTKREDAAIDDGLSSFFGDAPSSRRAPTNVRHEFGGLMDDFSAAPPAPAVRKSAKSLDPFDPFADDADDDGGVTPLAPSPAPQITSPPILPSTRTLSHSPTQAPPQVQSFPSMVAPQARALSSVATGRDDSFDAFFASTSSNLPTTSATRTATTSPTPPIPSSVSSFRRPVVSPPLRTSTLSPPPRSATLSPPESSLPTVTKPPPRTGSSPSPFFAPPPPPLQPVNRGGFNIAPPPSTISPVANGPRSTTPSALSPSLTPPVVVPPRPALPKSAGSGPLSLDDLSFFESL